MQTLSQLVASIAADNPECMGALLLAGEGDILASKGSSQELIQTAVAMALPLRELLDRTTAEMGGGAFSSALIEGTNATFALADVDGARMAIVIGAGGAAHGSLLSDAKYLAGKFRQQPRESN